MTESFSIQKIIAAAAFLFLMVGNLIFPESPQGPASAPHSVGSFPENVFVRTSLIDRILGPIETAAVLEPDLFVEPGYTHRVQFFIEEQDDFLYFCFYHGRETTFAKPVRGSLYFKRSKETGDLLRMRIFYKNDPDSYLSIEPAGKSMSRLNIFLLGQNLQQDIRLAVPLEKVARMPVAEIMRLSSGYVDWSFYLPETEFPFPVLSSNDELADQIRPYLEQLEDADDGAIDESGRYVHINDGTLQGNGSTGGLNCSGFAKWVVDGILYPETGTFLPIDVLKQKHDDIRGNRWSEKKEETEDPYFGLDWTRNLALEAFRVFLPEKMLSSARVLTKETVPDDAVEADAMEDELYEAADVDYLRYHEYKDDVGYPVEQLPTILYELALKNNERFYLASLNDLIHGDYELRKHYHVAVFFPWLDAEGDLRTALMESNSETDLKNFVERYHGNYVHLVEVPNPGAFTPGNMKLEPVIKR